MKKLLSLALILVMVLTMSITAFAAEITDGSGSVDITYEVPNSYIVTIPDSMTIGTDANVSVSDVIITAGHLLTVSVSSGQYNDGWKLINGDDTVGYTLKMDGAEIANNAAVLTVKTGDNVSETLTTALSGTPIYSGNYTDKLTFHVSVNPCEHTDGTYTYIPNEDGTTHTKAYVCCDATVDPAEIHTFVESSTCTCGTAMTSDLLQAAVAAQLAAGETDIKVTLAADAGADMFVAIRSALVETEGVEDGSIHLTLAGCTKIPEYEYRSQEWNLLGVFGNKNGLNIDEKVTQLASVTLPDVVTIGNNAFHYALNLTKVSAPKATSVGYSAFASCSRLTEVELPLVATVGTSAFNDCEALEEISLPSATTVGNHAFMDCLSLAKVSLPSATTIGSYVFQSCTELAEITFGSLVSVEHNIYGIFYGGADTNNITLTLSADQKVMTKDSSNDWTEGEELYSESDDYTNKIFMGYTFKDILLAD